LDKELVKLFCDLVKIPSPSGKEKEAMGYAKDYLDKLGIKHYTDSAGKSVGGNSGNLIAKIGIGKPKLMFVAHIDTVEDGKKAIKPIVSKGSIRSDGTTILGSDDKGGVAALLAAMKEIGLEKGLPAVLCVLSIQEERGVMGVNYLDLEDGIDFVFDVDGTGTPGRFINKALGTLSFEIRLYGKEAHAAANPEKGRNSIKAAGMIIAKLSLGRDSKWRALNLGTISGGTRDNVIPGYCLLTGMARAFDAAGIAQIMGQVRKAAKAACAATGCSYELVKKDTNPPFHTKGTDKIVSLARKASKNAGLNFSLEKISATIQGNALSAKGYSVLGLSKGGKMQHSKEESIKIRELEQTKRLIVEIVKAAE
jgi:tripeptide aminopeptidase